MERRDGDATTVRRERMIGQPSVTAAVRRRSPVPEWFATDGAWESTMRNDAGGDGGRCGTFTVCSGTRVACY